MARKRRSIPTVVVVYYAESAPLRIAIADHLYSIKRYASCNAIYINAAVRSIPSWWATLEPDLIVFHTTLLAVRWHPPTFARVRRKLARLRYSAGQKVAIPQDEFIHTDALCDFIREFGVHHVMTCADDDDQATIYGSLTDKAVSFTRVLTGYIDTDTVDRIQQRARAVSRPVDIAYRAWRPEYWLGRHAQLKYSIAEAFESRASDLGMTTDISVRAGDTLVGSKWLDFLLNARWTIGVEGGATILDRDGTLREDTVQYVAQHPDASFEEVEAACFPDRDGEIHLVTLSPRHLEACATRTAQVLIEGDYNGVLTAGVHYLPLKRDFSNLPDVLAAVGDERLRSRLADAAYRDIVASRRYDYAAFARQVVRLSRSSTDRPLGPLARGLIRWELLQDRPSWLVVRLRARIKPALRRALAQLGLLALARASIRRSRSADDHNDPSRRHPTGHIKS